MHRFKIGEKVVNPDDGNVGVVKGYVGTKVRYRLNIDGSDVVAEEAELKSFDRPTPNSSALNAKFKVGDRVRFTAGPIKGEYGKIISLGKKDGCYDVQSAYGEILTNTPEGELAKNSSVSSNSVVANALAARNGVARNADTEASIEAEAKKLAKEVLSIAAKFDALQKRLNKIGLYYTDYQAAANDLRNVHSVVA